MIKCPHCKQKTQLTRPVVLTLRVPCNKEGIPLKSKLTLKDYLPYSNFAKWIMEEAVTPENDGIDYLCQNCDEEIIKGVPE